MFDIVGYDSQGAPVFGRMAGNGNPGVAGLPQGARLVTDAPLVARYQLASGDTLTLAAGAVTPTTGTITISVQAPFRAEFLVLNSSVGAASEVRITSIKVGTQEQSIGKSSQIPIQALTPNNLLGRLQLDTASPGVDIVISLRNTGAASDTISCVAYGIRLQSGG